METENEAANPQTPSPGEPSASSPGGESNDALKLEEINALVGRNYTNLDDAKAALAETYKTVGALGTLKPLMTDLTKRFGTDEDGVIKLMEENLKTPPQQAPDLSGIVTKEQYEEDMFFSKNSEYEPLRATAKAIKNSADELKAMPWAQFVEQDAFKTVFEPYKEVNELKSSRSVLESNSRLGQVTDKVKEAKEHAQAARQSLMQGDLAGANASNEAARKSATASVIEAFNLK